MASAVYGIETKPVKLVQASLQCPGQYIGTPIPHSNYKSMHSLVLGAWLCVARFPAWIRSVLVLRDDKHFH